MVAGCDQLFSSHKSNSRLILIKWLSYTLVRTSEFCSGQVLFFRHKIIISTQNIFFVLTVHSPKIIMSSSFLLALIQDSSKSFN